VTGILTSRDQVQPKHTVERPVLNGPAEPEDIFVLTPITPAAPDTLAAEIVGAAHGRPPLRFRRVPSGSMRGWLSMSPARWRRRRIGHPAAGCWAAAFGVEPGRHRHRLDQRGLAGAVLTHQKRHPRREVQPARSGPATPRSAT
jgi:hypothetical protein